MEQTQTFTKETVEKASQLFLARGKQNNSTLEHEVEIGGLSVVESWIIEDEPYIIQGVRDFNETKY
mgnify:CR=1 FL=1